VCCAAPLLGLLGVAGVAATAVTFVFAGGVFALVVGLMTLAAVLVRRSRVRSGCEVPEGPVAIEFGATRTHDVG
jgi:hypothetical protein